MAGSDDADDDVKDAKRALRRAMKARLAAMGADAHEQAGEAVARALAALVDGAGVVALFASMAHEISTRALDARLLARRVRRAVPTIVEGALVFRVVDGPAHAQPLDRMGIPTPPPSAPLIALASCDVVVVPGVAFDRAGRRLGYGRGYYDRALAGVDVARCVAVLHDEQLVDEVPVDDHDVPLQRLCTPALGVFATSSESARRGPRGD